MRRTGSRCVIFSITLFISLSTSLPGIAETKRVLLGDDNKTSQLIVYDGKRPEVLGHLSAPVSYTHLRAHETVVRISYAVFGL